MILLLGASGYLGQAFANELRKRGRGFIPLTRRAVDYTCFELLFDYMRKAKPDFVINAAGFTGRPNTDACELAHAETVHANALLPQTVARVCFMTNTPWGHVSSGCIYSGAKVIENGTMHIEPDLNQPRLRQLFADHPEKFNGFSETDEPNFSFRRPPCSFYSGTKALAEEALREFGQSYIWRPRITFDEFDHPRNFLSEVQRSSRIDDNISSFSHLGDFARACLDLHDLHAPFGIYNVVNPGAISTRQVSETIRKVFKSNRSFKFSEDTELDRLGSKAPRSNCILDVSKLLGTGVKMRGVQEALEDSLRKWQPTSQTLQMDADLTESFSDVAFSLPQAAHSASIPIRPAP